MLGAFPVFSVWMGRSRRMPCLETGLSTIATGCCLFVKCTGVLGCCFWMLGAATRSSCWKRALHAAGVCLNSRSYPQRLIKCSAILLMGQGIVFVQRLGIKIYSSQWPSNVAVLLLCAASNQIRPC